MERSVLVGKFVLHAGPVAAVGVAMWHYLGGTSYIPPMITLASHGMALFCRLPLVMQSLSASGCLVHCARDVGEHVDIAGLMRCV